MVYSDTVSLILRTTPSADNTDAQKERRILDFDEIRKHVTRKGAYIGVEKDDRYVA